MNKILLIAALAPVVLSSDTLAQAPPVRGEGGGVQSFQGNAFRSFARFTVLNSLLSDGEEGSNPGDRSILVFAQPFVFSYTVLPGLAVRAMYPLISKQFENLPNPSVPSSNTGFGDLTLAAKYRFFFHVTGQSRTDIAVISGAKLPTGSISKVDSEGRRLPRPMQIGTGSTDFFGQIAGSYSHAGHGFSLFADFLYRENTNAEDFEFGDQWGWNLGGQKRILPAQLAGYETTEVYAELALQYQHLSPNRITGRQNPDSGGNMLFLAPGLSFILKRRYLVEASFQYPLRRDLKGSQLTQGWNLQIGTRLIY